MELTYAIFPAVKLFALILVITVAVLLYKTKHHRLNIAWGVLWALFFYLAPVKVDGTETKSAHMTEVTQEDAYHEAHALSETVKPVVTKKLTFSERMAAEDARSKAANQVITDEINK